jgi:hypothetical protein
MASSTGSQANPQSAVCDQIGHIDQMQGNGKVAGAIIMPM